MTKVKATRDCKISNKDFSYEFKANIETTVDDKHINVLLNTGLVEQIKKNIGDKK